jgi:hypothetical protein
MTVCAEHDFRSESGVKLWACHLCGQPITLAQEPREPVPTDPNAHLGATEKVK